MKRNILIIVFLISTSGLLAQFPVLLNGQYMTGIVMPHREGMDELQKSPVQGIELETGLQMNGNKDWMVAYNQPFVGLGLHYDYLGYPEVLGYAAGFYGFLETPVLRGTNYELLYRLTSGLTYLSKRYSEEDNLENIAISTRVNYLFHSGFRLRYWMSGKTAIGAGIGLSHYSNGAINKPNKGLNQLNLHLGITNYLRDEYYEYDDKGRPVVWDPGHEAYLLGVFGWTDIGKGYTDDNHPFQYSGTNQTYYTGGISIGWNYRYATQRKAGVSIDGFFDESLNWAYWDDNFFDKELEFFDHCRLGLGINHEFMINRLSILITGGVYLIKIDEKVSSTESNEWAYERLGFRYYILDNAFLNVSVKAYGFLAKSVEFGVGFSLNEIYNY